MIDIGLTKIALIGVVALIVIGPEKLPTVARMAGTLLGRAQRYINQVKSEVSREMELDELRKLQKDVQDAASHVEQTIAQDFQQTEKSLVSAWSDLANEDIGLVNPLLATPKSEDFALKVKKFRKKKLTSTSAVPRWYKQQNGRKTRVVSGAARVARYRPAALSPKSAAFFP